MEQFKTCYHERCAELAIEPLTHVENAIREMELLGKEDDVKLPPTLNLSSISLSLKSCDALAFAIKDSQYFTRLVLADAFLGDDGCIKIASALKTNTAIEILDLRGNGIRSDGTIALGQMLKVNNAIKQLYLEWNCLGIWDSGLKVLAEGLCINQSLETLDLRNNKIGPQAIQNLAICLKQNTTLKKLDIRWNHAGMIGGRAIADLLNCNKNLTDVLVSGNEIPDGFQYFD